MSIERYSESRPCFCGKGTIVSTWGVGDFPKQGNDGTETMKCSECSEVYEYRVVGRRSEDHSPKMDWIPRKGLVIHKFVQQCEWVYSCWRLHRILFDDNPNISKLSSSLATHALVHLSNITQHFFILEIAKLHDPKEQMGKFNLTIDYILHLEWDDVNSKKLKSLKNTLDAFETKIRSARNKIISHNDLSTQINNITHGTFETNEDVKYFESLRQFVDVINRLDPDEPFQFCEWPTDNVRALSEVLVRGVDATRKV